MPRKSDRRRNSRRSGRSRGGNTRGVRASLSDGYDAVQTRKRRTAPASRTRSSDDWLTSGDRRKMLATTRKCERNMTLAAWMIRKHIDYVATFSFQSQTGDAALDDHIEAVVRQCSTARNFEISGRFNRQRFMRLVEQSAVRDGDFELMKLASGHVQGIEGDRVCKPTGGNTNPDALLGVKLVHGLVISARQRIAKYCVCARTSHGMEFEKLVPAHNMWMHAYHDRIDGWRGVSPLAAALTTMIDLGETVEYNIIKAKLHALFGIAISTDVPEGPGFPTTEVDSSVIDTEDEDGDEDVTEAKPRYEFEMAPGGTKIELMQGDSIDTIESKTPSAEFQGFSEFLIHTAMLALDIPFTFWDSRRSSFSARIGDNLQYAKSCETKRAALRTLHNNWTAWRLSLAQRDGLLTLPAGMGIADLNWNWQAGGIPWTDPGKETTADIAAIAAGIDSPQRVCLRRGADFAEIAEEITTALAEYNPEAQFVPSWAPQPQPERNVTND
jgi:capsid protein